MKGPSSADAQDFFRPATKHVFTLFHSDPEIIEVTVKYRDGSGGRYVRDEPLPNDGSQLPPPPTTFIEPDREIGHRKGSAATDVLQMFNGPEWFGA